MNIPTHYPAMTDEELLRDLYAQNFHGDPLLEYVCQRWELLVDGNSDLGLELSQERSAREDVDLERDHLKEELDKVSHDLSKFEDEVVSLRRQNTALMQQYVRSA